MAIPGILMQMAKSNPMLGQIKQMMGMVRAAGNPEAMINQLMMNNPQLKEVMDIVNQYGGDPGKALKETAKQMGIDENDIIDLLR